MRMKARILAVVLAALASVYATQGIAGARPVPAADGISPIQHVVVLYLENHTFQNIFGFWCRNQNPRCTQGDAMSATVPLSDGSTAKPYIMPDIVPQIKHSVADQLAAENGGAMNGWQNVSKCAAPKYACIGGYTAKQQPNTITLTSRFAMSDRTFSLSDSPSWGGHLYPVLSNLDGFMGNIPVHDPTQPEGPGWGCDSGHKAQWAPSLVAPYQWVPACVPDPALSALDGSPLVNGGAYAPTPVPYEPTIMDELNGAGLSWEIAGVPPADSGAPGYKWSICPSIAECLYTPSQAASVITDDTFTAQAQAGTLPSLSIVTPGKNKTSASEHNGYSMTTGDNWIGAVANAIMTGPEWDSTTLFITWDDCGCFYDGMTPGVNPDGTQQGPRVPLVIVSPYAKAGYTDSVSATFASILAYTEHTFSLAPLGVNDAQAYDYSNAFDYTQAPLAPVPVVSRPRPGHERIDWAQGRQDT